MTFSTEEKEKAGNVTFNIQTMNNSPIQSGTVNSTQNTTYNQTDWDAVRAFIQEQRTLFQTTELEPKAKQEAEVHLKTAEMHVGLEEPNATMIQTAMNSFLTITQGAAGSAAFAGLQELLKGLG